MLRGESAAVGRSNPQWGQRSYPVGQASDAAGGHVGVCGMPAIAARPGVNPVDEPAFLLWLTARWAPAGVVRAGRPHRPFYSGARLRLGPPSSRIGISLAF
jgi:hypothetical protein